MTKETVTALKQKNQALKEQVDVLSKEVLKETFQVVTICLKKSCLFITQMDFERLSLVTR